MKIGIISDIHSNYEALTTAIDWLDAQGAEQIVCLGDVVGYGADPGYCARHCLSETARCLAGNHDLAAARRVETTVFVDWAREALDWTTAALGPGLTRELADLMPSDPDHEVPIFHAVSEQQVQRRRRHQRGHGQSNRREVDTGGRRSRRRGRKPSC